MNEGAGGADVPKALFYAKGNTTKSVVVYMILCDRENGGLKIWL